MLLKFVREKLKIEKSSDFKFISILFTEIHFFTSSYKNPEKWES